MSTSVESARGHTHIVIKGVHSSKERSRSRCFLSTPVESADPTIPEVKWLGRKKCCDLGEQHVTVMNGSSLGTTLERKEGFVLSYYAGCKDSVRCST